MAGYTGFRLPTLNELYRPFVVFPVTTNANEKLGLEKLKGVEGGIDLTPLPGVSIGVTGFYNRLDGAIANVDHRHRCAPARRMSMRSLPRAWR